MKNLTTKIHELAETRDDFRAVAETRTALTLAKEFPRDIEEFESKVKAMCSDPSFAEKAVFKRPMGSSVIEGPSIRLAEALAVAYGNIDYGMKILNQTKMHTDYEVVCFDKEANIRVVRQGRVSHWRQVKKHRDGGYNETRPNMIADMVNADAAKKMRNCILQVIPRPYIDMALEQCQKAVLGDIKNFDRDRMLKAFSGLGVEESDIGKKYNIKSLSNEDILELKRDFYAIKEEGVPAEEVFPKEKTSAEAEEKNDSWPDVDKFVKEGLKGE